MHLLLKKIGHITFLLLLFVGQIQCQKPNQQSMNDYKEEWAAIQKFEYENLPKSALKEAQKLYEKIVGDKTNPAQSAQQIKALLYINKYKARLEEDGLVKALGRFTLEIDKAKQPAKSILQSMVAEMYTQYLSNYLYKFRDRTAVEDYTLTDIRTWDIPRITQQAYDLYQASISDPSTQKVSLADFEAMTLSTNNTKELRPTVYDLLAHRALDFFSTEQYYLTKPAYKFYLDSELDFAPINTFVDRELVAKDSLSGAFQTLEVFQKLLRFHQKSGNTAALNYSNLRRIDFVYQKSILPTKKEIYLSTLQRLAEENKDNDFSAEVNHKIAQYYYTLGRTYNPPTNTTHQFKLKEALELCQQTIKAYPNSYGANHCQILINNINNKSYTITTESINPINKDILGLISYKNVEKLYFKAVPITKSQMEAYSRKYQDKKKINYLNSISADATWEVKLNLLGDFQTNKVEFAIPKLKGGSYFIMASADPKFSTNNNLVLNTYIQVSNLSASNRSVDGQTEYYITDRNTGMPLKGVKVDFFSNHYNRLLSKYEKIKRYTLYSDKNGFVKSKPYVYDADDYYRNRFSIELTHQKDKLALGNEYWNSTAAQPHINTITHFFLDRAIYRPGQTIYFKGIVLEQASDGKNPNLVKNSTHDIIFYDANRQKVAEIAVKTNEYGSFNGSFTAPSSGLLGQMYITDEVTGNSKYLRVEEYKRPKFEVKPTPLKVSYKINDSVTVKGIAKAYAGNNIDGAKVNYRVVREVRFPYWNWRWGWHNSYSNNSQEITFGETTTNEKGEYSITFQAIPDKSIPADKNPEFNYTVYVDVIDITGETHSATSSVRVGYIALDADIVVPSNVDKNEVTNFKLVTQNLNYQFEAAKGNIIIEKLQPPTQVFATRLWEKPNVINGTKKAFKQKFPQYAYKDEDQPETWTVVKKVLDGSFDTKESKELLLKDIKNWEQGQYRITMKTADKFGKSTTVSKLFVVFDANAKTTPINQNLFLAQQSYSAAEPGSTISVDLGSYDKQAYILYEIEHEGKITFSKWLQPRGRKNMPIKIEEKHRGGLHFHVTTVLNGRFYYKTGNITVPWTNKQLTIAYETFRDKLKPGQEEEWKLKISGPNGEKVAAEFLAGMYDASLDAFASNYWGFDLYPSSYSRLKLSANRYFTSSSASAFSFSWNVNRHNPIYRRFAKLHWHGFSMYEYNNYELQVTSASRTYSDSSPPPPAPAPKGRRKSKKLESKTLSSEDISNLAVRDVSSIAATTAGVAANELDEAEQISFKAENIESAPEEPETGGDFDDVKVRTNLNETVFFYPDLMTDEEGNLIVKFTMNEALTKWKFMLLGHTKDLKTVTSNREVVTQKELMVMPNAPRFFRENDEIYFTAKVSNLSEKDLSGSAKLLLFDAISMKPIDVAFGNATPTLSFEAKKGESAPLVWKLKVPDGWNTAITHRVVAKAGEFSDGEESAVPVLTNRMLVTETQPLPIRGKQTKNFHFKRMTEASKSTTLRQHKLTLEFTQNPAWYAVQSLPYLMEYPYECTEQIFSRYYANSLATSIANAHPKVKRVFDQWKNIDTDALKSNLAKNEELKYALLEETPWVLASQSEEVQKKNIGLLFDLNRMSNELDKAKQKLADRQSSNGGFSWFPGGRPSWYITQYLVEGMGHLDALGVKDLEEDPKTAAMMNKAVSYIDNQLAEDYQRLLRQANKSGDKKAYLAKDHLSQMAIHYFYARSFFIPVKVTNKTTQKAIEYYEGQAKKYALQKPLYLQGLLALGLHRGGKDLETPQKIVASARENALQSDEMGMYWKYPSGYYWYQLPIETHALMIEMFDVVAKDESAVEDLKVWLLKAKQTTHWKTTKATASACYALLMNGDNWLLDDQEIDIKIGGKKLDQSKIKKEAGTGYFKTTWEAKEITPKMAKVTVKNPNNVVAWGAMYWQYFEQLDKITHFKETPLKLNKKLFKQINTDKGPVLKPVDKETLEPGDLIKVRIELFVDRDMEYVHMKDMCASGLEPINVISQYKYQGGLGYYESTKDASTNFFFSYLSKGTYVFEYPLRVNHKGDFSNGVTTIQCMYAPEFTAHSEGVRIQVK